MSNLLLVANTPSPNTRKLRDAVFAGALDAGARDEAISGVKIRLASPAFAGPKNVLWADAIILGSTENFGYMSGTMKDFLERIYYPCLEKTEGMPAAIYIKGGLDGQGAKSSMERVLTGLKWKLVQPTLVFKGEYKDDFAGQCKELGMAMAAGLEAGVF